MKHASSLFLIVVNVHSFAFQAQASQGGGTVFLERGHRGKVPCPPITSRKYAPGDIDAMYWYYGTTSSTALLISYFRGRVAPQNGIPHGIYDIDNEFSLVIENVTAKDEGIYHFKLKPRLKMTEEGHVEVCDKVSSGEPYPTVIRCDPDPSNASQCAIQINPLSSVHELTCVVNQVKPAVELRWNRLYTYMNESVELNAATRVKHVVLPANNGSSLRNNTYSTSASIQVNDVDDDAVYQCEAMGVAVGSGSHMRVHFNSGGYTTETYEVPANPWRDGELWRTYSQFSSTATYGEADSSANQGTTASAGAASAIVYQLIETNPRTVAALVMSAVSLLSIMVWFAFRYNVLCRTKKRNEDDEPAPEKA